MFSQTPKYVLRTPMSTTKPTQLSYDVFVSDGPAGAGGERMPDGAPLVWSPLSSTLIFGAHDALLVDPPFTRTQIRSVGDWVERSGRRLAYIDATHGHGDHWFGTGELVRLGDKPTAREFYDQMTGLYPDRLNPGVVWLGARGLLGE